MRALWVAIVLGLSAQMTLAQDEPLPEVTVGVMQGDPWDGQGPPKMGTIHGEGDGDSITWTTYDFSIGAFDASAWVTRNNDGQGAQRLSILGYTASDSFDGRILFRADLPGYRTGTYGVEVLLVDRDLDAPRQKGILTMEVTRFDRDAPDEYYGDFSAVVSGTLCATANLIDCFEARFEIETRLQFGS